MSKAHKKLEKNINLMAVWIVVAVSIAGLVELLPLMAQDHYHRALGGHRALPGPAIGRARHLRARRLLQLPQPAGSSVPFRNRALRTLFSGR